MKVRVSLVACGLAIAAAVSPASALTLRSPRPDASLAAPNGLSDATILIVRHAEKPGAGRGLSRAGEMRAEIYARYFEHFRLDGTPTKIDALVATDDSRKSSRPRLTLEPLSLETGMVISQPCKERAVGELKAWLMQRPPRQTTLIAWHHTEIARILAALGANPDAYLPDGRWPDDAFDWVIALRFDRDGHLIPAASRIIHEPRSVDRVVWSVMDHPAMRPNMSQPDKHWLAAEE